MEANSYRVSERTCQRGSRAWAEAEAWSNGRAQPEGPDLQKPSLGAESLYSPALVAFRPKCWENSRRRGGRLSLLDQTAGSAHLPQE